MSNIYTMPKKIVNSQGIYEFISLIWSTYKNKNNEIIYLDFKFTKIIEPNLMAPLGLVLTKIKSNRNKIYFRNLSANLKKVLIENEFISNDSLNKDEFSQNYIKYKNFSGDANDEFRKYILAQLNEVKDSEIINSLISIIMELFVNVKMHARKKIKNRFSNKEIFSSGIYYKDNNYLIFSIANNGLTFAENIKKLLKLNYDNECDYVKWALQKANSTRETKSEGPGGLGLYLLQELIENCKGELIIVSGKGCCNFKEGKLIDNNTIDFYCYFPGTVITIKVPLEHIEINNEFDYNVKFNIEDLLGMEI